MTYGWEVAQPGFQAEVGRLEFSDAVVYIVADRLRASGRFEYRERDPSLGDWIGNHPIRVTMLILLMLIIAVWFTVSAVGKRNEFIGLQEEVARSRSAVIDAWVRRIDLVNRMLQVALHYENYEREIIDMTTRSFAHRGASVGSLVTTLSNSYPNLRASEAYQELMRQVASQEEAAREALKVHNAAAERHNTAVNRFPWNIFLSSERVVYLDTSMEEGLLPTRWDAQQLRFTVKRELDRPGQRIAGS
jgi:LemA protein